MDQLLKGRELIGLPVVSLATGKELGVIEDLVWNRREGKVGYLVIEDGGMLKKKSLVPFQQVNKIGCDAVTLADDPVEEEKEIDERDLASRLPGFPVISREGENMGTIEDLLIADDGGGLEGFEISSGLVGDLLSGRNQLPWEAVITWGEESAIVCQERLVKRRQSDGVSDLSQQPDR